MKKKFVSFLLAWCLVVAMIPLSTAAANETVISYVSVSSNAEGNSPTIAHSDDGNRYVAQLDSIDFDAAITVTVGLQNDEYMVFHNGYNIVKVNGVWEFTLDEDEKAIKRAIFSVFDADGSYMDIFTVSLSRRTTDGGSVASDPQIYSATINGVTAYPDRRRICFFLPAGTDTSNLKISFDADPADIYIWDKDTHEEILYKENCLYDFSDYRRFYIFDEDGNRTSWNVVVFTEDMSADCELYSFSVDGYTGYPDKNNVISIKLPMGTDLANPDRTIDYNVSDGAYIPEVSGKYGAAGGSMVLSGEFTDSEPVPITVVAEDGKHTQDYTLVVSVWDHEPSSEAKIYSATINRVTAYPTYGGYLNFHLPEGTDLSKLQISFETSENGIVYNGRTWDDESDWVSHSGQRLYDFSHYDFFFVQAENGQTGAQYHVIADTNTETELDNSADIDIVRVNHAKASFDGNSTFSVQLPCGSSLENVDIAFLRSEIWGEGYYNGYIQHNGQYVTDMEYFDLTTPQQFTVISKDQKTRKTYTVQASVRDSEDLCGDNVRWSLENGVLTISGTGPMDDYDRDWYRAPWRDDSDQITSVVISQGVTQVGEYAFCNYRYDNLTSITIAGSVKSIGERAFYDCSNLTQINLSNGLERIGEYTFAECGSLTSIRLPDSITIIEEGAFYSCDNLASVSLGKNLTVIGDRAFMYCSSLASVTLPSKLSTIRSYAFHGTGIKSLSIPASVSDLSVSNGYGYIALDGIDSFTVDPANKTFSAENNVLFNKNKTELLHYSSANTNSSYQVPSSVTAIAYTAFFSCRSLKEVSLPAKLTSLGNYQGTDYPSQVFTYCNNLEAIRVDKNNTVYSDQDGVLFSKDGSSLKLYPSSRPGNSYIIPAAVRDISEQAMGEIISLDYFDVASGNKYFEFEDDVFYGKDVTYRDVQYDKVLLFCRPQKDTLTVADGVDGCYYRAFDQYSNMGDWSYDYETQKEHFDNQTGYALKYIVFPEDTENREALGDRYDWLATSIYRLAISDQKPTVYGTKDTFAEKFAEHYSLLFVEGQPDESKPKGSCGDNLVYEADLESGTVTITGTGAMDNFSTAAPWSTEEITSLEIADGATSIGSKAFTGCDGLIEVTIPASVTSIDETAFEGCSDDLIIHGEGNTAAETIAMEQDIQFDAASVEAVEDEPMLDVDRVVAVPGRIAIAAEVNNNLTEDVSGNVVAAIYYQGKMVSTATLDSVTEVDGNQKARKILQLKYKDANLDDKEISVKLFYLKEDSMAPWAEAAGAIKE